MPAIFAFVLVVAACGGDTTPSTAASPAATDATPATLGVPSSAGPIPAALSFGVENDSVGEATVTFEAGGTVMASAADGTTFALVVPPRTNPVDRCLSRKRETPGNPMFPGVSISGGGRI